MEGRFPQVFGAYALLKPLGQGAMGDVHLARPLNPRRGIPTPVVIKRLHGELASNADFVRRFQHEANIAVSVDSPHVAKVFDVGRVGETLYIAMEYVAGWPLSRFLDAVIESGRHSPISAIIDLVAGALEGLEALHSAKDIHTGQPLGIIHRDISPKNLMVGEDGRTRLIDLGLGKSSAQDWKTRTGMVMGSVGYMPPEQVTADKIDQRADLYAAGVVLWELLSLRNFIKRGALHTMLQASVQPVFEPPSKFRPDVPPQLDRLLEKAVAPRAADRFQSARELLDALRAIVPERRSAGSLNSLIDELFASVLPERKNEVSALLALPLPDTDDGPEPERTVIFVQAPGITPLTTEELNRGRSKRHPRGGPGTMIGPQISNTPGRLPEVRPMPVVEALATSATDANRTYASALSGTGIPQPRGVSVTTLVVAIVCALALGAAGTWVLARGTSNPTVVPAPQLEPRARASQAEPTVGAPAITATPPEGASAQNVSAAPALNQGTEAASPGEPRTKRRIPRNGEHTATTPKGPTGVAEAVAPPPEVTPEQVKEVGNRVLERSARLLQAADKTSKRYRALQELTYKVTMAMQAQPDRALQELRTFDAELTRLEHD